ISPFEAQGPPIDSLFPEFSYLTISGDSVDLKLLKEKVVVINIWFVGCKGCKQEEPYLKKITESHQDDSEVVFLGFCMSKPDKIIKYLEKNGEIGYQNISLSRDEVLERFDVVMSPTHFVIKAGVLKAKYTGPIMPETKSLEWLSAEINKWKN
ncbi:MAG TPA: TlpA disulfide reductase family protein, partial [Algoriphagus sp.]|nr:TlpA disulfide reductase family protein [Algoriphagus sp.]